jgi:hypothetical protein
MDGSQSIDNPYQIKNMTQSTPKKRMTTQSVVILFLGLKHLAIDIKKSEAMLHSFLYLFFFNPKNLIESFKNFVTSIN